MQKIVGQVVKKALSSVKPNPWNPNRMTDFERESLKTGLQSDGWLISQAVLAWGTDENGTRKDLIIDGEHRWTVAGELGFAEGPMVFLDGITEAQAKALTIKMNAKRGKFQEDKLAELLKEIQFDLDVPDLSMDIGIPPEEMMKMLEFKPEDLEAPAMQPENRAPIEEAPQGPPPAMQQGHVKLVQVFYNDAQHTEFTEAAKKIAEKRGTKNISETVLAAMRIASA